MNALISVYRISVPLLCSGAFGVASKIEVPAERLDSASQSTPFAPVLGFLESLVAIGGGYAGNWRFLSAAAHRFQPSLPGE